MFGGYHDGNDLWKVTQNTDGAFDWNRVCMTKKEMPSPRYGQSCWEYEDKMWIFGGNGESPIGYLNNHGEFAGTGVYGENNQLLSYDPSKQTWKNVECSGEVPSPRERASVARINNKVWLYGGITSGTPQMNDELYELNMHQLAWTHIHTSMPKPQIFEEAWTDFGTDHFSLLVPVTANQLVMHGHSDEGKSTWVFDVESNHWRQFPTCMECYCPLSFYTGARGLHSDVIIFGIHNDNGPRCDKPIFSVMLAPKTLQQLAMRIIHQNKMDLPLTSLPPSLIRKLRD